MAKRKARVFISAAAEDAVDARQLADKLTAAAIDAWVDANDVLPGNNAFTEFGKAIERADAIVVLVSPASMRSSWVRREIQFALGRERFENRLIPVMLKKTAPEDIPWILQDMQWAKGHSDDVVKQIVDIVNGTPCETRVKAG